MPTVDQLYKYLDSKFPDTLRCDWDNDGLMVADDPDREVMRVLCTLDVTEDAVDYAIANNFDVIVSHHPMIFRPLKAVNYADPIAKKTMKLLKNGISVMSFHTRLDAASGGLNDIFAKLMGLSDIGTITMDGEPIGRIGTIPTPLACSDFASGAKKALGAERILYASASGIVNRLAICGGDGKDFIKAAKAAGADSYLTGQLSYNIMNESDYIGMNLFEAGHFHTEDFICSYLTLLILKEFTNVKTGYFNCNRIKSV
ncbi:MAG: Nif3-like dinuclear metal center hexameric protein [Eubacteriales bacterium]|nr:Nif3-like dinuclear metal center hexameric protein [Clostridiales bacterium]MDD7301156.1 Nif3-like dinuclear metal center hexameric protein [Eubacteriales bacterium]MDY4434746.1 Nif3-like dinuclear metal center hexameric protein [Candidatus Flemingibacterium sp.]